MSNKNLIEEKFVEAGAALEHDRWARWQNYMFSLSTHNDDGSITIPKRLVERWFRQIRMKYEDLPDDERESDRKETRNYLPLVLDLLAHQQARNIEAVEKAYYDSCLRISALFERDEKLCVEVGDAMPEVVSLIDNRKFLEALAALRSQHLSERQTFEVVEAPGDRCGNTRKLADGTACPGCRACQ